MLENIIHQIWLGKYKIPEKDRLLAEQIKLKHPNYKYMFWDNNNLPQLPDYLIEIKNIYQNNNNWVDISHIYIDII